MTGSDRPTTAAPETAHRRYATALLLLLFFASGFAALTYQVLWVRQLGLLFGSTAQAAALTIAIFFAGIAAGGWYWGRLAPRLRSSLWVFGALEVGVAVTALGHFALLGVFHALYPALYAAVGHSPALDTLAKALIATALLFPSAFLMGGTLPVMGQHLVRRRDRLAVTGTTLYAVNTAGAGAGALAAGFVLPVLLGLRDAYLLAVGIDLAVGVCAMILAGGRTDTRSEAAPEAAVVAHLAPVPAVGDLGRRMIWTVAFVSGFATLAVEVLWTRLFAQVLQNSAYTYALVLSVFLLALTLGALAAHGLSRLGRPPPRTILTALLAGSALATAASPAAFDALTDGLSYLGTGRGWYGYLAAVAALAVPVMLLPGTVLGAVLPYLLRLMQTADLAPGTAIGRLVAVNTAGAILGSLAAGFLLLPAVGAWHALVLLAAVYGGLAVAVAWTADIQRRVFVVALASAAGFAALVTTPMGPRTIWLDTARGERLIALREGVQAHVAVVEQRGDRILRVNNFYSLGSTGSLESERNQAVIPMLAHPDPRSVFFLGMGTGITAGAALFFPVERVVVCEILADVIALARAHFGPWVNGLFDDPRAVVHAEDGRACLRRSPERFDLIVSDLFTPWKAGTGNLYSVEHFRTARERLRPGGMFVQWIPLYQVSDQEFGIIARTMGEVFPDLVLWRGDLFPSSSIVALVGRVDAAPLDPAVLVRHARALSGDPELPAALAEAIALCFYAGNIGRSGLYDDRPLNTDTNPLIEYLAPRTESAVASRSGRWLTGRFRDRLYDAVLTAVDPGEDPYLGRLAPEQREYVRAGLAWSKRTRDTDATNRPPDTACPLASADAGARGRHALTPAGRFLPPFRP
jgi:spermidine synthase